jgi:hypothetical protein
LPIKSNASNASNASNESDKSDKSDKSSNSTKQANYKKTFIYSYLTKKSMGID